MPRLNRRLSQLERANPAPPEPNPALQALEHLTYQELEELEHLLEHNTNPDRTNQLIQTGLTRHQQAEADQEPTTR